MCVFVEEPSKRLFCMLCDQVFRDPVITTCGVRKMRIIIYYHHLILLAHVLQVMCNCQAIRYDVTYTI